MPAAEAQVQQQQQQQQWSWQNGVLTAQQGVNTG
jgi:hypothetical protein